MRKIIDDGAAAASKMTFGVLCLYSYLVHDDKDDDDAGMRKIIDDGAARQAK
jgi:hypothetical protein